MTGWDIWQGGVCNAILPRSEAGDAEKLLGKRGTLLDKHALAKQDLHEKLRNVRLRATLRHCAWDEVLMLYEWCARGHINYAPLIGMLRPPQMHEEDAALQRLILARLGVRRTAERMGLLATRQQGGLQLISVVESCLAATASDLISLLSGSALASAVARDSLRHALNLSPDEVENCSGVVPDAFRLLAGYGVYVTGGPDRFCSRMLDCLRAATADPSQPLLGPYNATAFRQGLRYCRVGPLANAVRATLANLRSRRASSRDWTSPATWQAAAPHAQIGAAGLAAAAAAAMQQSQQDWQVETRLHGVADSEAPEDWTGCAWDDPWSPLADPRSAVLDCFAPEWGGGRDCSLYSDGGFAAGVATFSAQARSFGDGSTYWSTSAVTNAPVTGRLPAQYGWATPGIHEAELLAMLCAMRWRRHGQWNMLVVDCGSLFASLRRCSDPPEAFARSLRHGPFEARLRRIMSQVRASWKEPDNTPSWRLQQEMHPELWNVQRMADGKPQTQCSLDYCKHGLVGVNIKSHQRLGAFPHPVVVQGNVVQDAECGAARAAPLPPSVRWPTGGLVAALSVQGWSIVGPPREALRTLLRQEACRQWSSRIVQGKLARCSDHLHPASMDVRWYQACRIPPEWARWQLQRDTETVDLAPMLYRLHRAIGGSWTEKLHSSAELQELATARAAADNPRLCPLCRNGAGTPRHVVMACSAMAPMADELRDALEQYFASLCSTDWWLDQARTTWGLHAPAAWAVCLEGRERLLGRDDGGHSAAGTLDERPHELAYRALVPKSLGHALCRACAPSLAEPDLAERPVDDGHTSLRQAGEVLSREQDRRRAARRRWEPVIACTTLLALGLRAIRAQYHARIDSWIQATRWQLLPQAQQQVQQRPEGPVLGPELGRWALTMNGQATIRELRWQVAPRTVLLARLRQEVPGRLPADPLRLLQPHGLPVLNGEALEWGVGWRTWDGVRMQLTLPPCSCHLGHPRLDSAKPAAAASCPL